MYWAFDRHHILPSAFAALSDSDKVVLRGFFELWLDMQKA